MRSVTAAEQFALSYHPSRNFVVLRVADDGCFREPIVPGRGMKIIEELARGLDGEIAQSFGWNGGVSTVVFPS
jgi:hypothetical protein